MQALRDNKMGDGEGELPLVQSYSAWWDMAGFDQAVGSQSVNWLEEKPIKTPPKNESNREIHNSATMPATKIDKPKSSPAQSQTAAPSLIAQNNWPNTINELHKAIESGAALPGNAYGREHIVPHYINGSNSDKQPNQKTIMLISDFPNTDDIRAKSLFSGKENQLIVNMLTAAGFEKHNIYCASLASTRPIYDELPDQDLTLIHAFIRHHIEVLEPDALISLGSAACNALLNAELMKSRESLHYFNLNNKDKELLTTFHPKTLLANPKLKQKAWRDLQLLMKKDIL